MNTMNMPGFTADSTLYSNHTYYPASVHMPNDSLSTSRQVMLQLRIGCFISAASTTYNRCVGLGHDSGECAQLGIDLGLSLCD